MDALLSGWTHLPLRGETRMAKEVKKPSTFIESIFSKTRSDRCNGKKNATNDRPMNEWIVCMDYVGQTRRAFFSNVVFFQNDNSENKRVKSRQKSFTGV